MSKRMLADPPVWWVSYDEKRKILEVEHFDFVLMRYFGVQTETFDRFVRAESVAQHYRDEIQKKHKSCRAWRGLVELLADLEKRIGIFPPVRATSMMAYTGDTILHYVCNIGDCEAARILLDNGADVHAIGEHNRTPIYDAVKLGHIEVVKLLLERGATLDERTTLGDTAREAGLSDSDPEMRALFRSL